MRCEGFLGVAGTGPFIAAGGSGQPARGVRRYVQLRSFGTDAVLAVARDSRCVLRPGDSLPVDRDE